MSERADFRSGYVRRLIDVELDVLLAALPAIHLDGPKGVGKTATALERVQTVRRLDRPEVRTTAEADPDAVLGGKGSILLDEWQRVPGIWDAVKTAVDTDPEPGRFILTGSLPSGGTHSGAGRIASLRMRPLTIVERGASSPTVSLAAMLSGDTPDIFGDCELRLTDYTDLILDSGFPGMQHLSGHPLQVQLDGYLKRIADADMEEAGLKVRRPATVLSWLRAYAAATSTTTSWDKIRNAASPGMGSKPARSTTIRYVDVLTRLRILDDLDAWIPGVNHLSRVGQAPKHHLADPALAARLVGVSRGDLLTGRGPAFVPGDGTFLGALFESLATMSVRVFAEVDEAELFHLRLHDGRREVDMVVERGDGGVVGLEVKLSGTVDTKDVQHLLWLRDQLGTRFLDGAILTTGTTAYRRKDGIAVIPLGLLGP